MNKTVLITGASRGIGRAAALTFGRAGWNVIINYNKNREKAENLADELKNAGIMAEAIACDVADRKQVFKMIEQAHKTFRRIDALVCNAGIAAQRMFTDITEDEWDRMFDVNVKGMFNCCQAVLPEMISEKSGKIVTVSSMWGVTGGSCEVHYSAAKAAVIGFTKALAKEVGPSGINVNCVAPGVISTEMNSELRPEDWEQLKEETPLMRIGEAQDVADTIFFLASEKADFITGQVISTNGGIVI